MFALLTTAVSKAFFVINILPYRSVGKKCALFISHEIYYSLESNLLGFLKEFLFLLSISEEVQSQLKQMAAKQTDTTYTTKTASKQIRRVKVTKTIQKTLPNVRLTHWSFLSSLVQKRVSNPNG